MRPAFRFLLIPLVAAGGGALSGSPSGAASTRYPGSQVFCVTAASDSTGLCPPDSPVIVGVTRQPRSIFLGGSSAELDLSVTASGNVYGEGRALIATLANVSLAAPIVGIAADPVRGQSGFWLVGADGGVFALDGAPFLGSEGGLPLNAPIVGIEATPTSPGYWLVGADGGVFAFGSATYYGSMGGRTLNAPVVGMATTGHRGYFLAAADGGVFTFGSAQYEGSMAGVPLNAPVVGIAAVSTHDYFLAGADGGIFSFGAGAYFDSFKGITAAPVIAVTSWSGPISSPGEPPWGYPTVVTSNGNRYGLN